MSGTTFWHRMVGQRDGYTRLGVLSVLTVLTDVLDQQIALTDVQFETTGIDGARAPLDQAELAEVTEMLGAIVARITEFHTATMKGWNVAHRATLQPSDPWYLSPAEVQSITYRSMIDARADVESQMRNYLMNSEDGKWTYDQFRSALGLPAVLPPTE